MGVALDFREQGPDSPTEGVETEGAEREVEVQGVDPEQWLALPLQKSGLLQGASYRQGCNRKNECVALRVTQSWAHILAPPLQGCVAFAVYPAREGL